jgi:hypothetical protein
MAGFHVKAKAKAKASTHKAKTKAKVTVFWPEAKLQIFVDRVGFVGWIMFCANFNQHAAIKDH